MGENPKISGTLSHLSPDLVLEIIKDAITKYIPGDTEILPEGQFMEFKIY